MADPPLRLSLADRLRAMTGARVGLGRAGNALPTRALLDFELAHGRARDAVHAALPAGFAASLGAIELRSLAPDRTAFLQRPDLGRMLDPACRRQLDGVSPGQLLIVAGDGLSAQAVADHAPPLIEALLARLDGWALAPLVVASQARVALGDAVGEAIGATAVVMLIGERPGLSAPSSLGAYICWAPRIGRLDSERNCVSNIWTPDGLGYAAAADRIMAILSAARRAGRTGVGLNLPPATPALPA